MSQLDRQVISEEKLQVELESAKKISELESQIILERNLKMNIEKQLSQASSEIELLNERSKLVADCLTEIKGLKVEAELRENEKKRIVDEFDRYRHLKEEVRFPITNTRLFSFQFSYINVNPETRVFK